MFRLFALFASFTLFSPITAEAVCPRSIVGSYSGYEISFLADGSRETNVSNHVFGPVTNSFGTQAIRQRQSQVNADTGTGTGRDQNRNRRYVFNSTNCRGYTWAEDGENPGTLVIRFFVVAASGNTMYFTRGPKGIPMDSQGNPSVEIPDSWSADRASVHVLTKQ